MEENIVRAPPPSASRVHFHSIHLNICRYTLAKFKHSTFFHHSTLISGASHSCIVLRTDKATWDWEQWAVAFLVWSLLCKFYVHDCVIYGYIEMNNMCKSTLKVKIQSYFSVNTNLKCNGKIIQCCTYCSWQQYVLHPLSSIISATR